jgi:hypothetical protein
MQAGTFPDVQDRIVSAMSGIAHRDARPRDPEKCEYVHTESRWTVSLDLDLLIPLPLGTWVDLSFFPGALPVSVVRFAVIPF